MPFRPNASFVRTLLLLLPLLAAVALGACDDEPADPSTTVAVPLKCALANSNTSAGCSARADEMKSAKSFFASG